MEIKDLELKLLAAEPVDVGVGKIHHLTLREITRMGEDNYFDMISQLFFGKNNIQGGAEKGLSDYETLVIYSFIDSDFRDKFSSSIQMVFKEQTDFNLDEDDPFFYLGGDRDRKLDEETIDSIKPIIRKANFLAEPEETEYKPGNEQARKFIEELNKKKQKESKPKETMNLHSMINGLAWKSNSINIFNAFDLTIYQLYSGFHTVETIDNYLYTLHGIYSGAIDGKKIKLDQLHWAKIHDKNK